MSKTNNGDTDTGADDDTDTDTGTGTGSDDDTVDHAAEARKWKALARQHEQRAKSNADKARQLDELEDQNKSELDRATAKVTAAEQRAAAAERRVLVLEVAAEKGLTATQAKRLQGDTRDELEADADELLENFTPTGGKPDTGGAGDDSSDGDDSIDEDDDAGGKPGSRRPRERLKPGASSDAEPAEDTDKIAERLLGGSF